MLSDWQGWGPIKRHIFLITVYHVNSNANHFLGVLISQRWVRRPDKQERVLLVSFIYLFFYLSKK